MSLISLTDYRPMPRYDEKPWVGAKIEGTTDEETWSTIATVSFSEPDTDPTKPQERSFTVGVEDPAVTSLRVVFIDDAGEQDVANPVSITAATTELATVPDVAKRLGRYLSESEEVQASTLIVTATNNIYAAVDKPSSWVPEPDARDFLSGLCVELVTRGMPNPHALASMSESLGQHSVTQQFSRDIPGSGVNLTSAEELAARRIVHGTNNASSRTRSLANDVSDSLYLDDEIVYNGEPSEYK